MMKPEEIKEALGEFYIDINEEKNKKIYVEVINKFINLRPYFKPPLKNKNNIKNKIRLFCKNNDLHLLDTFYFTHNVPFQIKGGENTFFLCVDNDNIKHIYTIRGMWSDVKELNDRLGLNTLINFYNAFVYNVVSPSKIMRDIKEIKMGIKNFKYPTNVCIKNIDRDYLSIYLINKISFDDDNKTLSIKDNGIGMSESTKKHLFDKFYQGDNSHSKEGNGLGLALVKKIIDIHSAEIIIESEVGIGSTFIIKFKK